MLSSDEFHRATVSIAAKAGSDFKVNWFALLAVTIEHRIYRLLEPTLSKEMLPSVEVLTPNPRKPCLICLPLFLSFRFIYVYLLCST